MNKRKILLVASALLMVAVLGFGGTLAYLTDADGARNVFTTGDVAIELIENFGDNDSTTPEKLLPATGSAQNGTLKNGVTKEVSVKNTGSEDAYVRVHIAIPNLLDSGDPHFDANKNALHFNYEPDHVGADKWDWSDSTGAPYEGNWNYYEETIGEIKYNVYVVTYEKILAANAVTPEKAMSQVYLDSSVTNEQITSLINQLGKNWQILVVAEGAQADGFADAYEALNTSFGVPGSYKVDWSGVEAK